MVATEWGWQKINGTLVPVPSVLPPAPDELLHLIRCNCKKGCQRGCQCRIAGLNCTSMCGHCRGTSCNNISVVADELDNPCSQEDDGDDDLIVEEEVL